MRQADHICYRCTSVAEYRSVCALLAEPHVGQLLIESMIGGRPIATFLLTKPMLFRNLTIDHPCSPLTPVTAIFSHASVKVQQRGKCDQQCQGRHHRNGD